MLEFAGAEECTLATGCVVATYPPNHHLASPHASAVVVPCLGASACASHIQSTQAEVSGGLSCLQVCVLVCLDIVRVCVCRFVSSRSVAVWGTRLAK